MQCPEYQSEMRRFGRNRNGAQRYQCQVCCKTFTPSDPQPLGQMRLSPAKAIMCLRMIPEGSSIRSIERLTGVNRNTIMALLVMVGRRCQTFLDDLRHIPVEDVQIDELWAFVGMKAKTRVRLGYGEDKGDCWASPQSSERRK